MLEYMSLKERATVMHWNLQSYIIQLCLRDNQDYKGWTVDQLIQSILNHVRSNQDFWFHSNKIKPVVQEVPQT